VQLREEASKRAIRLRKHRLSKEVTQKTKEKVR